MTLITYRDKCVDRIILGLLPFNIVAVMTIDSNALLSIIDAKSLIASIDFLAALFPFISVRLLLVPNFSRLIFFVYLTF